MKIAIVEDHAVVRDGLKRLVETEQAFEVVAAVGTAREALEAIPRQQPDIVLMDVSLPDMDGVSLMQVLRERCPGIKVAVLTMHDEEEMAFRAVAAGAKAYIPKTSTFEELARALMIVASGGLVIGSGLGEGLVPRLSGQVKGAAPGRILSSEESKVLAALAAGQSNKQIARALHMSQGTVKGHVRAIYRKLGAANRAQAAAKAIQMGLLSCPIGREKSPER